MNNTDDQTRHQRTGGAAESSPKAPPAMKIAEAKREEKEALETAVSALEGERPEALAQFAESARDGEESPKELTADEETAPRPTSNRDKHDVATRLLHEGAEGEHPDPKAEGVDKLPDRIIDRG
ncbi:hypothetical protein [Aestuariivirga sp.]|uniref:hypothetical protein n=1 Tax=Aestuariivirga sp. TaxID=2650926 RepID=UPI003BA933C1